MIMVGAEEGDSSSESLSPAGPLQAHAFPSQRHQKMLGSGTFSQTAFNIGRETKSYGTLLEDR